MSTNELKSSHILSMPDLDTPIDERGIGYVFFHKIKEHKEKVIQIDGITGEEDTYNSFLQRCIRTAIVMQTKGIKAKDVIIICSLNHLNVIVPYFAAIFLGAYPIFFYPLLSAQENIDLLYKTKIVPKMLFVSTALHEFAKELSKHNCEIVVFGCSTEYTPFKEFLQPSAAENSFQPFEADNSKDIAIMQFSSGSTGLPKLVCISHYAYLGQIQLHLTHNIDHTRIMMLITLSTIVSTRYWGVTVILGSVRIIMPQFDGNKLFKVIHLYKPTLLMLGPYQSLTINPEAKGNLDITSVKSVGISGSALKNKELIRLKSFFPNAKVWNNYGSCETGVLMHPRTENIKVAEFFESKLVSCGSPIVGCSYKVVNPETEETLGPNQIGELQIKSKYTASCYYNIDSSDLFDSNGWLKTGDLVYYDTDKYFYVVDRLKDLIRVNGKCVYPVVIENVLCSHPNVKETVVVGKTDLIDGEQPMAVVVPRGDTVTEEDLVKFVDEKVNAYMRLVGGVIFVDRLPVTPSGKVSRYLTKKLVEEIEQKKFVNKDN